MNMRIERGRVAAVLQDTPAGRELLVEVNGEVERAYQEPAFGVLAEVGDVVLLNTTAVRLQLGTGGLHFVIAVEKSGVPSDCELPPPPGHIMKLRYTPLQMAVHAIEEESHPLHDRMRAADSLGGIPVLLCELHSMLPAVVLTLQHQLQKQLPQHACKIVYVMTDGGALPLPFSKTVATLRQKRLLWGTVTVGHAYGGDLEAVNLYSGLLAARHVLAADCIVVAIGPGIVGTGTAFGHTGIEVGQAVNAVHALEGEPIVVPRLSFADPRNRHRGVSHHTLTALGRVALVPATVPLPTLPDEQAAFVWQQLADARIPDKHRLISASGWSILDAAAPDQVPLRTMGRTLQEDLAFFLAAGSAGEWAAHRMVRRCRAAERKKPPERYAWREEAVPLTDKNC